MPKYQIILESNKVLTDQEFLQELKESDSYFKNKLAEDTEADRFITTDFKLIYAQNLEGIINELWEKKENLHKEIKNTTTYKQLSLKIDSTFNQINQLFKLD